MAGQAGLREFSPGPSSLPSLKMIHWIIFQALRILGDVHLGFRPPFTENMPQACFPGVPGSPAD